METDGDAGIDAGELAAAFAATGAADTYTSAIDAAGTKITVTVADAAAANTVEAMTATFTNAGLSVTATPNSKLPTQVITLDSTIKYNTAAPAAATKVTATAQAAGSWTLNGSNDDIAFLPFGSDYAQSITVTNTGSVAGAITVDLTAGGKTYTKTLTAVADAKSVTNISLEVAAFAAASGITDNARIKVVVNAPDANNEIQVKGLYFHKPTTDRVLTY